MWIYFDPVLLSVLVICGVCVDLTAAQGYYNYNPYYPYRRTSASRTRTTTTTRSPYTANAVKRGTATTTTSDSTSNRLLNTYPSNGYGAYRRPSYGSAVNSIIADPYDRYRRKPTSAPISSANSISSDPYDRYRRRPNSATTISANSISADPYERYRRRLAAASTTTRTPSKDRVSKADSENAKFVGAGNQETTDEASRTFLQGLRRRVRPLSDRCRRDAGSINRNSRNVGKSGTPSTAEQGRFLFDLNVYNIYNGRPGGSGAYSDVQYDCGGGDGGYGGGGGGGLLGDLLSDEPYYDPPQRPLNNFLNAFAPGILQNALAATYRPPPPPPPPPPRPQSDVGDLQSDPAVDPNYGQPPPPPPYRPPPIYYDSAGASPITPAQLIGGVATTVNGIIQQLTGGVQPVYPGYG